MSGLQHTLTLPHPSLHFMRLLAKKNIWRSRHEFVSIDESCDQYVQVKLIRWLYAEVISF